MVRARFSSWWSCHLFQGTSHPNICWYVTLMVIGYALIIALGWSGGLGSSIQSIYLSFIFYLVYLLIRIRFFTMWIFLKPTPLWHHVIEVGWESQLTLWANAIISRIMVRALPFGRCLKPIEKLLMECVLFAELKWR